MKNLLTFTKTISISSMICSKLLIKGEASTSQGYKTKHFANAWKNYSNICRWRNNKGSSKKYKFQQSISKPLSKVKSLKLLNIIWKMEASNAHLMNRSHLVSRESTKNRKKESTKKYRNHNKMIMNLLSPSDYIKMLFKLFRSQEHAQWVLLSLLNIEKNWQKCLTSSLKKCKYKKK